MTEERARREVIEAGRRLVLSGLIARTWGNVSCRVDSDFFIITPSGRDYLSLKPEDLVKVAIKDCSYHGSVKPSSEKGIHRDLYEQRPNQNFVIHTHQKYASVMGTLKLNQIEIAEKYEYLSTVVICAQYGLPGTKILRKHVKEAVGVRKGNAVLMKNHGALCYGIGMEEAFQTAMELEEACKHAMEQSMNTKDILREATSQISGQAKNEAMDNVVKIDFTRSGFYTRLLTNPLYQKYGSTKETLLPFLDDFAQIVGTRVKNVGYSEKKIFHEVKKTNAVFIGSRGVLLCASRESDLDAIQMILEKNCLARMVGAVYGGIQPIGWMDRQLMRFVYQKKYSKKMTEE